MLWAAHDEILAFSDVPQGLYMFGTHWIIDCQDTLSELSVGYDQYCIQVDSGNSQNYKHVAWQLF